MSRLVIYAVLAAVSMVAASGDPAPSYVYVLSGGNGLVIARDSTGNIYTAGNTTSATFPATAGAFQTTYRSATCGRGLSPGGPCFDVFVAKWDPSGIKLLWATYLGGSGDDVLGGMAVDASGNVYLTGWTNSSDFPVTAGAFQTRYRGTNFFGGYELVGDAFVAKLNAAGTALIFSTYLGGSGSDSAGAIAIDESGNAYVTGTTNSTDFPVTNGALQSTNHAAPMANGAGNAFIVKLNAAGSALVYSTYLGGSGSDAGSAIAVDTNGVAYIGGNTTSTDFPITPGAFQTSIHDSAPSFIGGGDGFIARIDTSGSKLLWATYFGGSAGEQLASLVLSSSGQIYIGGTTDSSDLPVIGGALKTTIGSGICSGDGRGNGIPCTDVFIARFDPSSMNLTYSTYVGGTSSEAGGAIAVDNEGYVYVAGETSSADFPVTPDAFQSCSRAPGYPGSAFVAKFKPGNPLLYSTFLGGSGGALATGIAVDMNGAMYITGTLSPAFRIIPGSSNFYVPENDFPPPPVPFISWGANESGGVYVTVIDPSHSAPPSRVSCVTNAASLLGGAISPGELVEIYGKQIGPDQTLWAQLHSGTLGTSLGGVEVLFNGVPASLISVQSQRIEAVVPYELLLGRFQADVQVVYNGRTSGVFPINIVAATPAVFSLNGSGKGQAAVLNQDGTPNSPNNPAPKGSVISIFCTGLGTVTGSSGDGNFNTSGVSMPAGQLLVDVGGWPAEVLFAGGAPGEVFGVFQINARVPPQPSSGPNVPVEVLVDGAGALPAGFGDLGLGTVTVAIK